MIFRSAISVEVRYRTGGRRSGQREPGFLIRRSAIKRHQEKKQQMRQVDVNGNRIIGRDGEKHDECRI